MLRYIYITESISLSSCFWADRSRAAMGLVRATVAAVAAGVGGEAAEAAAGCCANAAGSCSEAAAAAGCLAAGCCCCMRAVRRRLLRSHAAEVGEQSFERHVYNRNSMPGASSSLASTRGSLERQ